MKMEDKMEYTNARFHWLTFQRLRFSIAYGFLFLFPFSFLLFSLLFFFFFFLFLFLFFGGCLFLKLSAKEKRKIDTWEKPRSDYQVRNES